MESSRRSVIVGALALAAAPGAARTPVVATRLEAIRARFGGRLGVAAVDTGSGRRIAFDADRRFAMCSTFKLALAAAVLERVDRGRLLLDRPVRLPMRDLVSYSPAVEAARARGELTVGELGAAIVSVSDNTAANLLLELVGGPAGLTRFLRAIDDRVTRLDRIEPDLNMVPPGDVRDTTTPAAMLATMRRLLAGPVLSPGSRALLARWLSESTTGLACLRAGLPRDWRVGDKTGRNGVGAAGDLAIAWPPGRPPVLIAAYLDAPTLDGRGRDAVFADVARAIAPLLA